jgi:hypothetical protein
VIISSRTPEGDPNCCPICGHNCRLKPSEPSRDGSCPHCGHLLWFGQGSGEVPVDPGAVVVRILEVRFGPLPPEREARVRELARGPIGSNCWSAR